MFIIAGKFSFFCTQQAISSGRSSIPYPGDQSKFIFCTSVGNYVILKCEAGLRFSIEQQRCISGQVVTTPATIRCPTPSWIDSNFNGFPLPSHMAAACNGNPSTICEHWYRRFPVNPGMFIECSRTGAHLVRKCTDGLVWNDQLQICLTKNIEPDNCPPIPAWVNQVEVGLPLDVPNTCPTGAKCNKYLTYPFNINKFIECDKNGVGVIKSCPPGWHWTPSPGKCVNGLIPTKAPIDGKVNCGPNPCHKSKSDRLTPGEMFHNCAGSNKHFIMCDSWGNMFIKQCKNNLDWSQDAFSCGPAHVIGK